MNLHKELNFEREICEHLAAHGWLHSANDKGYDKTLALYPEDLVGWLKDTQSEQWAKLEAWHKGDAEKQLLERVAKLLDQDGPLEVLRKGFKCHPARFDLCQFRPAHGHNPESQTRYAANRLRVVQQLRYSLHNGNSIDLVFFVNGVPLATAELKTDFTQTLEDAKRQYRHDRLPRDPVAKQDEPLLAFNRRTLVHFAVSTDRVAMATRLSGKNTFFLPFDQGHDEGAGNPPGEGYRTAYLWERVLQRDAWLQILGSFMHLERKEETDNKGVKKTKETLLFPRFHQWEAVNALVTAARVEGAGRTYLVQHSAGSGKTNSISWLAHRLAVLHDAQDSKAFDSVIVITDRAVLDAQLQEAIAQIEHKTGFVKTIDSKDGAKSAQLKAALVDGSPIIVVTLQTFPFVLEAIQGFANLKQRRFAVIADEAHSSQTGAAARKLKEVLTAEELEEGTEYSAEDIMLAEMAARTLPGNVSFFAFTATPKAKTIELFGRRPDPGRPPSDDNKPEPFHVYSMRQAIEEEFILDVLINFMPYRLAYKLAHNGKEYDDEAVEKSEGMKQLARWVRLHPYNISQKVAIIVEHFRQHVGGRLDGQAKAMVVTASRKEAVRYKLAMDKYLAENKYGYIQALVAFSGEVIDPDSGPDKFTEANMNPALAKRDIRKGFETDEFQLLLVANKFQTGFDQPKLVAMYVDKRLSGVSAVQTLSRLNRMYPGKKATFVLDFVNDAEEIRKSFEPYFRTAQLSGVSDPNLIHDLQVKLDGRLIYTGSEVDGFTKVWFDPKGTQKGLQPFVAPAVERFRGQLQDARKAHDGEAEDALEQFVRDLGSFVRMYDFLSQIVDYGDTDLEKRYHFFKCLIPWVREQGRSEPIDLSGVKLTHYKLREGPEGGISLGEDSLPFTLKPITDLGSGEAREDERVQLSELVKKLNDLFEGDLTDTDTVAYVQHITGKLLENQILAQQAASNSKAQFALGDFNAALEDTVIEGLENYQSMASQVLGDHRKKQQFADLVLGLVYDAFQARGQEAPSPAPPLLP